MSLPLLAVSKPLNEQNHIELHAHFQALKNNELWNFALSVEATRSESHVLHAALLETAQRLEYPTLKR